jgi:lipopolysaccharide assembly outer membrane protein LptD (OstA)
MKYTNKMFLGLVSLFYSLGMLPFHTLASDKPASANQVAPIEIAADDLNFSDSTGDIYAKGNVIITRNTDEITSDLLQGNIKSHEIWTDSTATILEPKYNLAGTGIQYNYENRRGSISSATGHVGKLHVGGEEVSMTPDEVVIHNGMVTTCPAKVPDYHISADKIEVWPGDKLIAYNAKFWIRNMVLFSLPKYELSLRDNKSSDSSRSPFPSIGLSSGDGVYVKQSLTYPLTKNLSLYTDLVYYSKANFKPTYGFIDQEKNYDIHLLGGYFRDSDGNWIQKRPELEFSYYAHRLGHLPASYTFGAAVGNWIDSTKSSWHQDYNFYLSGDPIHLGSSTLNLGAGMEQVRESYEKSIENSLKLDAVLTSPISSNLSTSMEYHSNSNLHSIFAYNQPTTSKELDLSVNYRIDHMNSISVRESYDLVSRRVADLDYTWNRNIHCFEADVTYRAKRKQVIVNFSTAKF